ncbi:DNA polymerase III subunit epsilon [Sphingobium sp. GW456-12-10-14-TSB1]|jgi:nucleoside-diphosphate-sugar epimerase|uniref:vitamin K epoxide reductase family protein n=1 Tax=unclassified Sphingobium TaxID=2611147 RepID=UPI000A3A5B77|nr:vitamin K epoxide reductase family protein [Sphingobium sp. GW456-12-10-14-TSB1]OUC53684.1 DNA polymerase III subunit epsilon [Sphingobium sp. GW456-12-10-14-TSB1]
MTEAKRSETSSGQGGGDVVLITGASGFIAAAVIAKLSDRYTVVGLDRAGPPDPPPPAAAIDFDLGSDEAVRAALNEVRARYGNRIASVIHLAAYYDITGEPNPLYDKITVQGTRRLIDGLQSFEVEQFVFASTMLVHKPTATPEERINEESPIGASWAYPQSKVDTEALLHEHHGKIPVVYLRAAGVYDDDGRSAFLAQQISQIYEHRLVSHFYPGMLCAAQSSVHRDDLADAVLRLVDRRRDLPAELPLLIGEPDAPGYAEIQDIVGETLHGEGWRTIRIPQPLAKAGIILQNEALGSEDFIQPWMIDSSNDHYILDISRARSLLGWEPKHNLRDTLPTIVAALKRHPRAWYRNNKLNENLVAWNDNPVSKPAESGHHQAGAVAGMAGMGHGGMDHSKMDHSKMGHEPGAAAKAGHAGHGDHMAMMDRDERRARWALYANIGLGLWLASSPLIYDSVTTESVGAAARFVTVDRGLPSVEWRANALSISDFVSGLAIALFGALSLSPRTKTWAQWAVAFVGIWLFFAPLIFWSPSAAQYNNNLLIGSAVIALSVLVPMMPGMSMAGMMDPKNIPPGWTYSPSTDAQRLPIVAMGLIGLLTSRILTAYQLGHIDTAWEPFFAGSLTDPRNGTEEIITSDMSKAWPIPDGGLGTISYVLEILMAVMGTRDRWRTMPWMVTFFGILVIPLGVVSIYFIISQPIVIGTWSTLALIAALAMLIMIPFALDEVIAMGQFLGWAKRRGKPLIRTFFQGDAIEAGAEDTSDAMASPSTFWADAKKGLTLPWTLTASIVIGALLMLTRVLFGTEGGMANSDHVVGALVITVAIIATAEVARALRLINIAFGAWLVAAPFLLDGVGHLGAVASVVAGIALIGLSFPRGKRSAEHYASWDKYVI